MPGLKTVARHNRKPKEKKMKTYTEEEIKQKVTTDWLWAERALLALYKRQTEDEQRAGEARHDNGVGFNAFDASLFSYCAEWLKGSPYLHLNNKFSAKIMSKMGKYARQLKEIAEEV